MEKRTYRNDLGEKFIPTFQEAGLPGVWLLNYYQTERDCVTDVLELGFEGGTVYIGFYFGTEDSDVYITIHVENGEDKCLKYEKVDFTPAFEQAMAKRVVEIVTEIKKGIPALEQLKLKEKITKLENAARRANRDLSELRAKCTHSNAVTFTSQEALDGGYASAVCTVCNERFGWYCPKSPDHACHYSSFDGKIQLVDGTKVPVPEGHDKMGESDDWCIFCGEPDERK